MSTKLSLREALERAQPVRDISENRTGSAVGFALELVPPARTVTAAKLLVTNGLTLRAAHAAVDRLARRERVALVVPKVEDMEGFVTAMREAGVIATPRRAPESVDVKALRSRLGLTQAEFAARFGLDEATLRNWEQGRNRPDPAARTLLRIIERHPEVVEEALSG